MLQPLSWLLPPTWGIEALRDVMLRGWGIERVWLNVLVLAGFAVAFSALAVLGLKRSRA
ncbi:MAG TPA: ABC transporter permease [Candidatus Thermoplasmatota archaeon]|nr:ABC transporter permease [Candidatus Thermoplasmatota archaeon]